jgi:8-oxo-dGTP pyrophosphatase MutT (NUDIX family)
MRETEEETALSLDAEGMALGRMEPLVPSNPNLPPISIFPFIFGVGEEVEARVASREVDEVLWTPLSTLADPGAVTSVSIHHAGAYRDFPCFRLGPRVIWGLTYRILTDFFERLKERAPDIV